MVIARCLKAKQTFSGVVGAHAMRKRARLKALSFASYVSETATVWPNGSPSSRRGLAFGLNRLAVVAHQLRGDARRREGPVGDL
jgi:hypothetical protein